MKHLLLPVLLCLFASNAHASDWTKWRGPHGDGISRETAWQSDSITNKLWNIQIGPGHSSMVILGQRLYTMGQIQVISGVDTSHEDVVFCIDTETSREIWRYTYPCPTRNFPGPRTTPLLEHGRLYTLSWTGKLFCFNAQNGKTLWQRDLLAEKLSKKPYWGFSGSPVIDGDHLLITAGHAGLALNKKTGEVIWQSKPGRPGLTSPVFYTVHGQKRVIISSEKAMHGVNPQSGELLWSYAWEGYNDPIVVNGKVLLSGDTKGSVLLDISNDKTTLIWKKKALADGFQNVFLIDGAIYGFGWKRRDQTLQCVDFKTGTLHWAEDVGMYGSIAAAGDRLILQKSNGELAILKATKEKYTELAKTLALRMPDLSHLPEDDRCYCWTPPVLANGQLYIRDNFGTLAAIKLLSNE